MKQLKWLRSETTQTCTLAELNRAQFRQQTRDISYVPEVCGDPGRLGSLCGLCLSANTIPSVCFKQRIVIVIAAIYWRTRFIESMLTCIVTCRFSLKDRTSTSSHPHIITKGMSLPKMPFQTLNLSLYYNPMQDFVVLILTSNALTYFYDFHTSVCKNVINLKPDINVASTVLLVIPSISVISEWK